MKNIFQQRIRKGIKLATFAALLCSFFLVNAQAQDSGYPKSWWDPIDKKSAPGWEVLPQEAAPGEVILSKRNELGLLSNFAHTPFTYHGKSYESLEGFWQMMKFPETDTDERAQIPNFDWKYSRDQVSQMVAFEAKDAGSIGSEAMNRLKINWVTFEGKQLPYRVQEKGPHYQIIKEATWAKVLQNPNVKEVLLKTGDLTLKPDHNQGANPSPAWKYYEILTEIRDQLKKSKK